MNQKYIWIGLAALILIIGAAVVVNNRPNSEVASTQSTGGAMMEAKDDTPDDTNGAMMAKDDQKMMSEDKLESSDVMMEKSGSYKDYSASTVSSEQDAGNKVVLFFHAPWCPFCRTADSAFKSSMDKIPAGVTVLKTDYDSNTELKTKYGVTTQHTFVQIDDSGNLVTKWVSGDIDTLLKNIK